MKIQNINKQIGNRIRIARISRNLSQDSIAEDLGISVSAYSNMERGVVDVTVNRIIEVAAILKIKWCFLLGSFEETESGFEENLSLLSEKKEKHRLSSKNGSIDIETEISLLKEEIRKLKRNRK